MIPQKKVTNTIASGKIYSECSHESKVSRMNSRSYFEYCNGCSERLYNIQTEIGTYYVTFKELKLLTK